MKTIEDLLRWMADNDARMTVTRMPVKANDPSRCVDAVSMILTAFKGTHQLSIERVIDRRQLEDCVFKGFMTDRLLEMVWKLDGLA